MIVTEHIMPDGTPAIEHWAALKAAAAAALRKCNNEPPSYDNVQEWVTAKNKLIAFEWVYCGDGDVGSVLNDPEL